MPCPVLFSHKKGRVCSTLPNLMGGRTLQVRRFQVSWRLKRCVGWVPTTILEKGDLQSRPCLLCSRRAGVGQSAEESLC